MLGAAAIAICTSLGMSTSTGPGRPVVAMRNASAMVAASVAGLTIYDMLKGVDRDMVVSEVKLLEKSGGRSGHYQRREGRP